MSFNIVLSDIKRVGEPYQGKANDVWQTDNPEVLEIVMSDRVSAGNGEKRSVIPGKGRANCAISKAIFKHLEAAGIKTHFLGAGSQDSSIFVHKAEPIKLEVIGRFFTKGSFCKRFLLPEDIPFSKPFVEFTYKCDEEGDPPMYDREVLKEGLLRDMDEVRFIRETTEQVAYVLRDFFSEVGAKLIDFKIEFGRIGDSLVVIDEVSGDTVRAVDLQTGESLDKDRFRKNLENVSWGYDILGARVDNLQN